MMRIRSGIGFIRATRQSAFWKRHLAMAAGIKDVAERAGVSAATVSRVLSKGPVSQELRERVQAAIKLTGYRPNLSARRLRSQHSQTIGLMVSDIRNPFFTTLSRAVEDIAYAADLRVILCNTDENPDREAMYLRLMEEERVTGLVYAPTVAASERLSREEYDFPMVLVDRTGPIGRHDSVVIDNVETTAQLVGHLHARGYRRILGLFGNTSSTAVERHAGFVAATSRYGLEAETVQVAPDAALAANEVARRVGRANMPDAIVASNNMILLGVVQGLHRLHLDMPGDVAVAGFDNEPWTALVGPGLTVIEQPVFDIGRTAMSLLFDRLKTPDLSPRKVMLSAQLIERGSTPQRL